MDEQGLRGSDGRMLNRALESNLSLELGENPVSFKKAQKPHLQDQEIRENLLVCFETAKLLTVSFLLLLGHLNEFHSLALSFLY